MRVECLSVVIIKNATTLCILFINKFVIQLMNEMLTGVISLLFIREPQNVRHQTCVTFVHATERQVIQNDKQNRTVKKIVSRWCFWQNM